MKTYKASITIFLSATLLMILSVILSITEMSRMKATKLYLQLATNASIDSMLSLYNRNLYKYYRLFGVDIKNDTQLEKEYFTFLKPFLYDEKEKYIKNWFLGKLDEEKTFLDYETMTDNTNLENQIVSFMKYAMVGKVVKAFSKEISVENEDSMTNIMDELKKVKDQYEENAIYEKINERYFNFNNAMDDLIKGSNNLKNDVDDLNKYIKNNSNISTAKTKDNGKNIRNILNNINSKFNQLKNSSNHFRDEMSAFREAVEKSEEQFEIDLNKGTYNYSEEVISFINGEFKTFKDFVDKDSEMNKEVVALINEIKSNENDLNEMKKNFNTYISDIESCEDEIKEIKKDTELDPAIKSELRKELRAEIKDIEDSIGEDAKILKEMLKDLSFTKPNIDLSDSYDKKKTDLIKTILNFGEDTLLTLVLDKEEREKLDSSDIDYQDFKIDSNHNILNNILIGEYIFDSFNYYKKYENNEKTPSESTKLEVEKIISKKDNDKSNLTLTILRILALRTAFNSAFIYNSVKIKENARNFVFTTIGAINPVVAEVIFILILAALAIGQSIVDMKRLLKNKRVVLYHSVDTFIFSVENLLELAKGELNIGEGEDDTEGITLNYKDYLRLLLMLERGDNLNSNMASLIEYNMTFSQKSFDLEKSMVSIWADNEFSCPFFFTNMVFYKSDILDDLFKIKTVSYGDYTN